MNAGTTPRPLANASRAAVACQGESTRAFGRIVAAEMRDLPAGNTISAWPSCEPPHRCAKALTASRGAAGPPNGSTKRQRSARSGNARKQMVRQHPHVAAALLHGVREREPVEHAVRMIGATTRGPLAGSVRQVADASAVLMSSACQRTIRRTSPHHRVVPSHTARGTSETERPVEEGPRDGNRRAEWEGCGGGRCNDHLMALRRHTDVSVFAAIVMLSRVAQAGRDEADLCANSRRSSVVRAWRARWRRIFTAFGVTPSIGAASAVEMSSMSRIRRIER